MQLDSPVSPGYKGSFEFLSQVTQAMQKDHRSRLFAVDSDALNTVAKKLVFLCVLLFVYSLLNSYMQ